MKSWISALALLACFSAYGQQAPKLNERLLKEALEEELKDSDSAKIKDMRYKPDGAGLWLMCGRVNAKNSYGAYAGYQRFSGFVEKEGQQIKYLVLALGEIAEGYCQSKGM